MASMRLARQAINQLSLHVGWTKAELEKQTEQELYQLLVDNGFIKRND